MLINLTPDDIIASISDLGKLLPREVCMLCYAAVHIAYFTVCPV